MNRLLIHAWAVRKYNEKYFLPYTHFIYLHEIAQYFDQVILLSPCQHIASSEGAGEELENISNVQVYELPYGSNYIGSIKHFIYYVIAYKSISDVSTVYARYPKPFGWLQKIFYRKSVRIVHYVGDPVDAALNNPHFSSFKKNVLVFFFFFEDFLYRWACKGAAVYTNGAHIADKLSKSAIPATSLISSTLVEEDFYFTDKSIDSDVVRFIYVGYLRTAKGVETIIDAFALYNKHFPDSSLTIVGDGELSERLADKVRVGQISNITFIGNVQNRSYLNHLLRSADIFLFASLSEGSPRVVLEAMANGLPVISTPVGSLPSTFTDHESIVFSEFNDSQDFFENMKKVASTKDIYQKLRLNAYEKVRSMTIKGFIKNIFCHD